MNADRHRSENQFELILLIQSVFIRVNLWPFVNVSNY